MAKPFRAFLAIDLDAAATKKITKLIHDLKNSGKYPQIKWTKPKNLHLTIYFLGNITPEQYEQLAAKLSIELSNFSAFNLQFSTMILFPSKDQQIALALKPEPIAPLVKLNKILEQAAIACDIKPEMRTFIPHLTLGKIKGEPVKDFASIKLPELQCTINQVKFYRSEPKNTGSVYTPMILFQ
jgi:RNA 2',3'-cyclic 3'-phosphodiesterase